MENYIKQGSLEVDKELLGLINDEIIPSTNITSDTFWKNFEQIIERL